LALSRTPDARPWIRG